jgi:hypothetical protein
VARPDEHAGSRTDTTDTIWGGPVLYGASRYVLAYAGIPVPFFVESPPNGAVLLWTGLDGYLITPDVIQSGVKFEMKGGVGHYNAWFEYFCPEFITNPEVYGYWCGLHEDPSVVVSPGDSVIVFAWEGDSNCNRGNGFTGYGCYWLWNYTTGYANGWRITAPNNLFFGITAEGILERYGGRPVSAFLGARIDFLALDSNGYEHNLTSDNYINYTLVNSSGSRLVESRPTAPYSAYFFWNASE